MEDLEMKTQVIVVQVNHYNMQDNNKGLSVRIVGDKETTNNKFGLSISDAAVPDYNELNYLVQYADQLPAKFDANLGFVAKKAANSKDITSISLSNLKFVNSVEFKDLVPTK